MAHWLSKVCDHHKEWVKIAKVYGVGDYAEDLVQEVYIKLHKYASEKKVFTNGNINKGYVFFAIRNAAKTHHKKKMKRCDNHSLTNVDGEWDDTTEEQEAWGRLCERVEERSKTWKLSDKKIFDDYRLTKTSMRKLGAKYDISWVSIFTTIKTCREKLKDELNEDYQSYKKGDYEKIKGTRGPSRDNNKKDRDKETGKMDSGRGLRMRETPRATKRVVFPMAAHAGQMSNRMGIRMAKTVPKGNGKPGKPQ